ncbi:MAG: hypothetical protein HY648_08580 [Acidobacteria bacterium]|nr:hypothetical protein [Acidobacteriota bacterium]
MPSANFILVSIMSVALCTFPSYAQQHETHPAPSGSMQGQQQNQGATAQQEQHTMQPDMPGMSMPMNDAGMFLMNQASGTSVNPQSSLVQMRMRQAGSWNLMFHGSIFVNEIQQTGPRGGDKFFSTNWFMGMAERKVGTGSFLFRAMMSLDPLTVTKRRYPELFQTGETAFGRPIIDGQHPHELFMELSLQYAKPLGENTMVSLYFAPVGDPALGPVAFPHRISAEELPQAPFGHHVQDSTHIANEVITTGFTRGPLRIEASGFHGAEPNENRWNIDHGAIDSWSARLAFSPGKNWSAQASFGRLERPEALEPGDIVRSTASITYSRPLTAGFWATSLIWGRNHKTVAQQNINSYLAESLLQFSQNNRLTARLELVDKEELFAHHVGPEVSKPLPGSVFRIAAYTFGYTRDFNITRAFQTGLGGNFTVYGIPTALKSFYGERPASFLLYLRIRPQHTNGP